MVRYAVRYVAFEGSGDTGGYELWSIASGEKCVDGVEATAAKDRHSRYPKVPLE